ncbi:phage tail tape measure protein [Fusobacterium varium]
MAKNINVLLSLKDQFTKPLQNATKNTKEMDRHLQKASNKVKAFGNATKESMKKAAKYTAIGFGALTAAAGLFIKQSIDAAKDKLKVDRLLEENLKRTKNFSIERMSALKDEAGALQDLGVVGDDVILAGAGQLAMYKLNYDQIKKTMPILGDMVAKEKGFNATQEDSIAMADAIGKAMDGKTKGLLKYGVQLTKAEEKVFKTMKAEKRLDFITKKLNTSIGGTNKALRETDEGKIISAQGAFGDMQAEVGKKLIPYLGKLAVWFHSKIPGIQDLILGTADKVEQLIIKIDPYVMQIKQLFGSLWDKGKPALEEFKNILLEGAGQAIDIAQSIIDNWDRISPIVYTVVGALAAYKTVMFISSTYTLAMVGAMKLKTIWDGIQAARTKGLTIQQIALNVAMSANPIGLVITAVAALVGIGWMLYKNWDLVKAKTLQLWEMLDNNPIGRVIKWFIKFGNPIGQAINLFLWLKENIYDNWDVIKNKFIPILEMIKNPVDTAKNAIGGLIDKLKFWNNTEIKDKTINIIGNKTSNKSKTRTIGRKALGTSYFKGGETQINEGGRTEMAILPAGTKVMSHEQSKTMIGKSNQKVEVHVHISGNFIGEREHMERYAEYTGRKVIAAIGNM